MEDVCCKNCCNFRHFKLNALIFSSTKGATVHLRNSSYWLYFKHTLYLARCVMPESQSYQGNHVKFFSFHFRSLMTCADGRYLVLLRHLHSNGIPLFSLTGYSTNKSAIQKAKHWIVNFRPILFSSGWEFLFVSFLIFFFIIGHACISLMGNYILWKYSVVVIIRLYMNISYSMINLYFDSNSQI